jgi:signal transduction histidine kinase
MTRRIFAGLLGLLVFLLGLVVGPLGVKISAQQRDDFRRSAQTAARALANTQEERLGDTTDASDGRRLPAPSVDVGDGAVILGRNGQVIETAGRQLPSSVLDAVRAGRPPSAHDAVVVTAPIGPLDRRDGTVVLVRDAGPLDKRVHALWLALAAAAAVTVGLGAVLAAGLARWIGRPLRTLGVAATSMGHGDVSVRTDTRIGPPEVRAVATAFNDMAQRLGVLLDSQRSMTADVSHQLRTPLAALQLRLELLADDSGDDVRSELTDALREIERLNRLLDGLLAVARAEGTTAEPVMVDVADVVRERAEMWQPLAQERDVSLTVSAEPAFALVTPDHLEQVLDNLIANAMDALSPGDRVDVALQSIKGDVVLKVSDNGPGMSLARRASAFDRFESDQSGRKSGLGLAIVARLLATDGGSIALEETVGGGLTAVVELVSTTAQSVVGRDAAGHATSL